MDKSKGGGMVDMAHAVADLPEATFHDHLKTLACRSAGGRRLFAGDRRRPPRWAAGGAGMINRMSDPVCRGELRPDQAVAAALFEGEWAYFCSPTCYAAFLDTPHLYRGWASDRHRGAAG